MSAPTVGSRVEWIDHALPMTPEEKASLDWPLEVGHPGTVVQVLADNAYADGTEMWAVNVQFDNDMIRTMFPGTIQPSKK